MKVICYHVNGNPLFEEAPDRESFIASHPSAEILYIFDQQNDEILTAEKMSNRFEDYAWKYGFLPEDCGKEFSDTNGERYRLESLLPKNRKWTVLLTRLSDGQKLRSTPAWVKSRLAAENAAYNA